MSTQNKSQTSIVFTGDIGFDRYMSGKWNDPGLLSEDVLAFLKSADHVAANIEGPVIGQPENTVNSGAAQLLHSISPDAVKVLKDYGIDIWNINNNHIMDAGQEGLESTLKIAKQNGIATIGAGMDIAQAKKPLIIPDAGGIGMFGVGYQRACRPATEEKGGCFSWSELDMIRQTIEDIKKECRWCVVVAHAGEEFTALPSPYTRERYLKYLEMGADIVVAHHPHVPMNYETVGDKIIFYSLGNFIFDTDYQRTQNNTDVGVLVRIDFTEDSFSFEPFGIKINRKTERIEKDGLTKIFEDVSQEEYELLAPLAAKLLVQATKRQMKYLFPAIFRDATENLWQAHFNEPLRTGRVPGETLDFQIVCPLAEKEKEKAWKRSTLENVKSFILDQIEDDK